MKRAIAFLAIAVAATLAGCASPSPGPVQPIEGPSAPGVLVLENALQPWLDVPSGQQNYSYNQAGLLEYNTVVRNRGSQAMTLAYTVYCTNDAGQMTEEQPPQRFFVDPNSEKPLRIAAANRDSRKMRVQIRLAK